MLVLSFLLLLQGASPSPIISNLKVTNGWDTRVVPVDQCYLPLKLGENGKRTFLEDCRGIGRFESVPKPMVDPLNSYGVHPVVCCPKYLPDSSICFESDPWCATYVQPEYDYEEGDIPEGGDYPGYDEDYPPDGGDYAGYDYSLGELPKFADDDCDPYDQFSGAPSQCVALTKCPANLNSSDAPTQNYPCGFDTDLNQLKICCPLEKVTEPQDLAQPPRFPKPGRSKGARSVEDKSDHCRQWKRAGACELDRDFLLVEDDPYSQVSSRDIFDFMQKACPATCAWAPSGCHDEHPRCEEWTRQGRCVTDHFFMAHTCRESCGVCGFLSPENKEIQKRNGKSYTDFTMSDFDCGRYGDISKAQGQVQTETTEDPRKNEVQGEESNPVDVSLVDLRGSEEEEEEELSRSRRSDEDLEVSEELSDEDLEVFSFSLKDEKYSCGSTLVNDRWMITAAHCYDDFNDLKPGATQREVRVNNLRENTAFTEIVEIKRVYSHPLYTYPLLYNDVAVLELGRRVPFDYEKYQDSPICLDQSPKQAVHSGAFSTIEGYGKTEKGTRGQLLKTNVNVISDEECKEMLAYNITKKVSIRAKGTEALPYGLDGLFCTQGYQEGRFFSGSCKGDSGGPLYTEEIDPEKKKTLIGIVSGGIGCGKGVPGWYTKVSSHANWFRCIIDKALQFNNNQELVEKACRNFARKEPECIDPKELIFGKEEFENWSETANKKKKLCEEAETPTTTTTTTSTTTTTGTPEDPDYDYDSLFDLRNTTEIKKKR